MRRPLILLVIAGLSIGSGDVAFGQVGRNEEPANPVYLDDAPVATETISRALMLADQDNTIESARVLAKLIVEHGDKMTPDPGSPGVSIMVRDRVRQVLMDRQEIRDRYVHNETARAQRLLDGGDWELVYQRYWMTDPGLIASFHQAQVMIESGAFVSGIRVLEGAMDHPDAHRHADRAHRLSQLVYSAHPTDQTKALVRSWSAIGGIDFALGSVFDLETVSTMQVSGIAQRSLAESSPDSSVRIDGMVSRPIVRSSLTARPMTEQLGDDAFGGATSQPRPWIMPVVLEDVLITNDGITISKRDRFTLEPSWSITTNALDEEEYDRWNPSSRSRLGRTVEDMSSATIDPGLGLNDLGRVYVAAGLSRTGSRTSDDRLLSIDLETGRVENETRLGELDPALEDATIRGSVVVVGDTLVVCARRWHRRERLVSLSLVGLDKETFAHKWTRPMGSAGSLPFQQVGQIAHSGIADGSVVYWTDLIGVACAVDVVTGEMLWARAMPSNDVYARAEREAWTVTTPIVDGDRVFVLSTDGNWIIELDSATGAERTRTRAMSSGRGIYMISDGSKIVCINRSAITVHDLERFGSTRGRSFSVSDEGFGLLTGRVVFGGDHALVPVKQGVVRVSMDDVASHELIELETTGNMIALDGQLIVADENEVSCYLSWEIAHRILDERITKDSDTNAAVTLTDLAYRSDHHEQIVMHVDRAMALIESNSESAHERDRLLRVVLEIVGLPTDDRDPELIIDNQIRQALLQRTQRIARTVDQVLADRMTRGAWVSSIGDPIEAVAIYHSVLGDEALSGSMWEGGGLAIRAQIEATHQLNALVEKHGRRVCARFDPLAESALDSYSSFDDPIGAEHAASRYPWSSSTPMLWHSAAKGWLNERNAPAAARAATEGVASLERLRSVGHRSSESQINQIGSILIESLLEAQRPGDAAIQASKFSARYPSFELTIRGEQIDSGSFAAQLSGARNGADLGTKLLAVNSPALIAGYPVEGLEQSSFDTMVMHAPQLAMARMMEFIDGEPSVIWTRQAPDVAAPIVAVHSEYQTILVWAASDRDPRGGRVESIETRTGKTQWVLEDLIEKLDLHSVRRADRGATIEGQFTSPSEGSVPARQMLVNTDGSVVVIVDRIGRGIGIDALTGKVLWNGELPVNRVHDLDVSSGVIGIVGMWYQEHDPQAGKVLMRSPRVASIDARSGETIQLLDAQTSTPRWVRVGPDGNLFVGTSQRVLSVSSATGTQDWVLRSENLFNTNAGWIVDDTLVVLDESVNLYPIEIGTGRLIENSIGLSGMVGSGMRDRIYERGWSEIKGYGSSIVAAASGGVGVFEPDGTTIGVDAQPTIGQYVDAMWGEDRMVMMTRALPDPNPYAIGSQVVNVRLIDQFDAKTLDSIDLVVPSAIQRQPSNGSCADGVVVIGFGEVSVVLKTE